MALALFEILDGRFRDGSPVSESDMRTGTMKSIQDHLARLLNARSGVLEHLPEYGLPDVPGMYEDLPYSLEDLALAVQQLIMRFEPRLKHVQVRVKPSDNKDCVVFFEVAGALADGSLAEFQTFFNSGGHADIRRTSLKRARPG